MLQIFFVNPLNYFLRLLTIAFCGISQLNAQTPFTDVSESAGIDHQFKVYEGMFGGGACVFDFNKDGFEDFFLTSGMNEDRLYKNNGDGTFTNVYIGSGLELTQQFVTHGVAGADVNRDGWVDLFITTITTKDREQQIPRAMNLFFLNNGDGTFRDATAEFRIDKLESFSTGPSFGDFNADGYPDLYIGNYFHEYEGGLDLITDATIASEHQTAKGYLLMNKGGKYFENVYEDYRLTHKGFGFGGVFTDFDNDGDQDLLVNHDFGYKRTPNLLLENQYPRSFFKDVAEEVEMDLDINAMGAAMGDINEDGFLDYFISNIRFNRIMMSQGAGKPYVNKLKELGMYFVTISWGANFADFDHDGDLDLFVSNGDLNPNCVPMANFYFENEQGKFVDQARAYGVNDYGIGRGSVVFDIENDGDLDILVINQEPVRDYPTPSVTRLYRNDSTQGNWLKVKLEGVDAETRGIGSRVEVVVGGKRMIREIDGGGSSHLSQNSCMAHFGLGNATEVDSVIVKWTGGNEQIMTSQPVNQLVTIVEIPMEKSNSLYYLLGLIAFALLGLLIYLRKK